ncbi:helix-turn-helix transcriptional regulator [Jeongeupia naejangsanensis]|uniref:Helix-turn-helix transcriptional regulator n=1 Tax=Jeongeupia naejangsanensis TaxID=613195 RepID=A0ABS2BKQ6_9NEIS|nr:helix-turn-helix transcriptional regulator [Jeongeupia naejangsanensis]MBM3116176.1 helix-turn-helix transcriptional regulator [Jeongeupia naejangsanensis]
MSTIYQEMFDIGEGTRQVSVGARRFHHPHLRALAEHELLSAGHSEVDGHLHVERIGAPFHVVLFCVDGGGVVTDGASRLTLGPGQMAILPALGHSGFRSAGTPWRLAWLLVNDVPAWRMLAGDHVSIRPLMHADSLYQTVRVLCAEAILGQAGFAAQALLLAVDLFRRALASHADEAIAARLQMVFEPVRHAPAQEWRVEDFARAYGVSAAHLHRLCVRHLDATPQQLIIRQRMRRARELLVAGAGNVATIAEQVGYQEVASFSRRFRQHFDVSPGALLQAMRAGQGGFPAG